MKSYGAIEENVIYWMNGKQIRHKAVVKFDFIPLTALQNDGLH
jgi:hypothetical protein